MKRIRVAVAVLNQTPFAWAENVANVRGAIDAARTEGAELLCLPELCITGYGCEDMFHAPSLVETAWEHLLEIAAATRGMVVSVGLPVLHRAGLYNAAALLVDGAVAGLVAKRFLAGDGIHYEPRWFKAWPSGEVGELEVHGHTYPIGDLTFDVGGLRIGFEICEDAWVASRPGARMALSGVDLLLNPSASHFAFGKQEIRRRLVLEGSRAFGVTYLYTNLLGNEAGRAIYDGGGLIASGGELVARTSRFSFDAFELVSAVVDVDKTRLQRARTASYEPQVTGAPPSVRVPFTFTEVAPERRPPSAITWEEGGHAKEEEFVRAVSLGLFDYLRKSRAQGYAVSLSGGADSAACACLVASMVRFAVAELGLSGARARLAHVRGIDALETPEAIVTRLLTTAYQSTANSGSVTRDAARAVAESVSADHFELDVDALVRGYVELVEGALDRRLAWETDDLALQNIQARTRGPSIWLLANVRGQILLATSNRSEAAVGYTTMDGDTCGGLSPIAGIDKAFLRSWLAWMQTTGPEGLGPHPALAAVTAQAPTAELRPASEGQTDEGDLMPYPLLDAIERAAIRDKKGPLEVYAIMRAEYPDLDPEALRGWVERFFTLWCRNQWKRERYAPSFHLDDENLDPKTWCRFPILSGGFAAELEALRSAPRP